MRGNLTRQEAGAVLENQDKCFTLSLELSRGGRKMGWLEPKSHVPVVAKSN